jgi:hypothetical protein
MLSFNMNWLAFFVALVVTQALGFLWYGNAMFAKPWMKGIGKTAKQLQANAKPTDYVYTIVGAAIMLLVLANVLGWAGANDVGSAVMVAVIMWVGFVAPGAAMNSVFEGRPWSVYFINNGYHLVNMVIAAVILTVLG